jgi:hypothetical protein
MVKTCAKGSCVHDLYSNKYDIFITDQTGWRNISIDQRYSNTKFARFILDEADSINVPAVELPTARFKWFITATPMSLVTGSRAAMVDMRRYCQCLTYDYLKLVRVSSTPEFVDASLCMPPMMEREVMVRRNQLNTFLRQYVPDSVRRAMDALDFSSAVQMLGCEHVSGSQENLVAAVIQRFEKELKNVEGAFRTAPASVLNTLEARMRVIQEKISSIQDRIRGTDCCPIGFTEFTEESVRAVVPCCQNVFLLQNIIESIRIKPNCPFCRATLDPAALIVLQPNAPDSPGAGPSSSSTSQPDTVVYNTPVDALRGIVESIRRDNASARILVFSEYSMINFGSALEGLRYKALQGHSANVTNTIKEYNAGSVQVLLLNVRHFGAGINLELTDHIIVLHELEKDRYTQLVGRSQRPGRSGPLTVWNMIIK